MKLSIKYFIYLITIPLIALGCGTSGNFQYIAPEYRSDKQSNATLLVLPYISKIVSPEQREIINQKKNSERKPVTSKEISFLENYLYPILAEKAIAKIIIADETNDNSKIGFELKPLIDDETQSIEMFVPLQKISYKEERPDYILIIEDLYFLKNFDDKNPSLGQGTREIFLFEGGIKYLLWDNRKMTLVSFGELSKKMKLLALPTKDEYLQMLDGFMSAIIDKSPIYKKVTRF